MLHANFCSGSPGIAGEIIYKHNTRVLSQSEVNGIDDINVDTLSYLHLYHCLFNFIDSLHSL